MNIVFGRFTSNIPRATRHSLRSKAAHASSTPSQRRCFATGGPSKHVPPDMKSNKGGYTIYEIFPLVSTVMLPVTFFALYWTGNLENMNIMATAAKAPKVTMKQFEEEQMKREMMEREEALVKEEEEVVVSKEVKPAEAVVEAVASVEDDKISVDAPTTVTDTPSQSKLNTTVDVVELEEEALPELSNVKVETLNTVSDAETETTSCCEENPDAVEETITTPVVMVDVTPKVAEVVAVVEEEDDINHEDEFKMLTSKVQDLREGIFMNTKSNVTALLEDEIEATFTRDLDSMTKDELKVYMGGLVEQLKSRATQEAIRLNESLRQQEQYSLEKREALLDEQKQKYEEYIADELRRDYRVFTKELNLQEKKMLDNERKIISSDFKIHRESLEADRDAKLNIAKKQINLRWESILEKEVSKYEMDLTTGRDTCGALLAKLKQIAVTMEGKVDAMTNDLKIGTKVHQIELLLKPIVEKMETNASFSIEFDRLVDFTRDDDMIQTAMISVPSSAVNGIPTMSQLHQRFIKVAEETKVSSKVPTDSGLVGLVYGRVMSALTITPLDGEGNEADQILFTTEKALKAGDLMTAATELSKLEGAPADTCRDFYESLLNRLAMEHAILSIKTYNTILTSVLY